VEGNKEIYRTFLEYGVYSDIKDKVEFIISCSKEEAIKEITVRQLKSGLLPLNVFALPSALSAFPDYYRPIYLKLREAMTVRLDKRLKYQKFSNEQLTICLLDFGYFLRKEIHNALKTLGHTVVSITGNKSDNVETLMRKIVEIIITTKPDFILTVNHLGFDEEGILSSFLESIELPVAVWYVDSPNIIVQPFKGNISDNTVLFLWDSSYRDDMASAGFKNIFYLPLATDEKIFKPIKLSKKAYKRYHSKIAFVGNSMVDAIKKKKENISDEYAGIITNLSEALSKKRIPFNELIKQQPNNIKKQLTLLSEQDLSELEADVYWNATKKYRLNILRSISKFYPTIYGDRGWKQLLKGSFRLREEVNYYKTLPVVYNATDININATSLQMPEGVNQRVFDVPACGGFLLTDYQKALEELFDVGKEVVVYKDTEELPELIKYYLENDTERKKIAERAYRRVISEHTYVIRIKKIIETMKRLFG